MLEPALPDHQNTPPQGMKPRVGSVVSSDVATELLLPEPLPRLRRSRVEATSMAVPEAAMNENGQPVTRQHQVGGPRKVLAMKAKAVPKRMEVPPQEQLRLGITAFDTSHHAGADPAVNDIVHANLLTMNILQVF